MRIALTFTDTEEKHGNYVRWLQADTAIQVVKLSAGDDNLEELTSCDALVLAGGRDIHPKFYHNPTTGYPHAPKSFDETRDEFEIAAFQLAQQLHLPVLGICRGMQLVNCILGGSLQQDLGDPLNRIHKIEHVDDKAHGLTIDANTELGRITQTTRSVVNSAHHQAIDRLGDGLKVNCHADDGTIEGLEWAAPRNKSFLLCVQWHPERMFSFQLEHTVSSKNIRDTFIEAIKK